MPGQQLVAFGFGFRTVRHEVGDFLVAASHALIERRIHLGGEVTVRLVADGDVGIGVSDEAFSDRGRHRPPGATGFLCGSAGADEVGVGGAARVGREVEQHARPAGAAMQQPFEVLDVPCLFRGARFEKRLHLIEQGRLDEWFMRSGTQCTFVTDHPHHVVRVRQHPIQAVLP